ncbi:response regulator transcription factor [Microbispora sp. H10836]|uniref:response regulator n=1 Tax=Microbispora sp. H10836 TaxID=2729106 RepID=UPI0014729741|nr:response regulator transcription factor [Microbispora sp. H10836]
MTIKVLLADDQALVRAGFRSLPARSRDVAVVGEAANGAEAVRLAASIRPDLVLMDIRMPGTDGITATRSIVTGQDCRVVILTTFDTDEHVFAALRAGASGFLTKDVEPAELRRAVTAVAAGDALLSPGVTRRVIERFARRLRFRRQSVVMADSMPRCRAAPCAKSGTPGVPPSRRSSRNRW